MIHNSLQNLPKPLPLVSIVIPVYNAERFIAESLASLLNQTYKNIEVLCIDDGSTDRSAEIVNNFVQTDARVKLIQIDNHGPGHARNMGIQQAEGKYIIFMDSDDQLEAITVDVAVANAEKYGSDFVIFDWLYCNEKTHRDNYCNKDPYFAKETLVDAECHQLLEISSYYTVNKLYNREYLIKNDIKYAERYLYEDTIYWLKAVAYAKTVSLIHSPLYRITTHTDSSTQINHNTDKHYREFITTTKECVDFLTNNVVPNCGEVTYNLLNYMVKRFALTYLKRTPEEYKAALLHEFVDLVSGLPVEDMGKDPLMSYVIKHDVFLKRKYSAFKRQVLYSAKYKPLIDKKISRCKKTGKHILRIPHYISVIAKKCYRNMKARIADRKKKFKQKLKALITDESVYQKNLKLGLYEDVILFMGFDYRYTGNSRYLFEQMLTWDLGDKKLFFITKDPAVPVEYRIAPYTERSERFIARSKVIIFESWIPLKYVKRNKMTWIQLWHGTPLKRMLFDSHEGTITQSRPVHKLDKFKDIQRWDYLVVDTPTAVSYFKTAFLFPEEKQLTCGYPRVKHLLDHRDKKIYINTLKRKYGVSADKKIVLYLPTWRDYNYGKKDNFDLHYLINLSRLQELLGDGYEIIYKDHAYLSRPENVDFKNYSGAETQELLLIADYLITDYSSVLFDALAIDLPLIMYCNDFEENERDRGVYEEMWQDFQSFVCDEVEQVAQRITSYQRNSDYDIVKAKYSYTQEGCDLISFILDL